MEHIGPAPKVPNFPVLFWKLPWVETLESTHMKLHSGLGGGGPVKLHFPKTFKGQPESSCTHHHRPTPTPVWQSHAISAQFATKKLYKNHTLWLKHNTADCWCIFRDNCKSYFRIFWFAGSWTYLAWRQILIRVRCFSGSSTKSLLAREDPSFLLSSSSSQFFCSLVLFSKSFLGPIGKLNSDTSERDNFEVQRHFLFKLFPTISSGSHFEALWSESDWSVSGGWSNQYQYHICCNICLLFKSQSISVIVMELEQVRSKHHLLSILET